jgi:uncharacterized protein YwgA
VNKGQKSAVILDLARKLLRSGSWCGETHLQKASYLLQQLLGIDTEFEFILYKHGPFSFELRDTLAEITADGLLENVVRQPGYGPTVVLTSDGKEFLERFPKTLRRYERQVEFVADHIGDKGVSELERLVTAVYLNAQSSGSSLEERADKLVQLKPHISVYEAREAFREAGNLALDAAKAKYS